MTTIHSLGKFDKLVLCCNLVVCTVYINERESRSFEEGLIKFKLDICKQFGKSVEFK